MKSRRYLLFAVATLLAAIFVSGCRSTKKGNRKANKHAAVGRKNFGAPTTGSTSSPSSYRGALGRANSYNSIETNSPILALTFDDGPHPENTPRLLDILRSRNVKATFYVTGGNARKHPHILRRMIAEGHEIGNHTLTHSRITRMSPAQVRTEIHATHQAVQSATGIRPRSFRPPYGAISPEQKSWIKAEFGLPSIMWSVDPEDWKKPGTSVITSRLVNGAQRGGILLLHDIHRSSVDATPATIDQLKRRGFHFVTVSQLISSER